MDVLKVPRNTVTVETLIVAGRFWYVARCECGAESEGFDRISFAHDWSDGHRGLEPFANVPPCTLEEVGS